MESILRNTLSLKRAEPAKVTAPVHAPPPRVPEALLAHFWFVWCPDGMRPKKRHASLELAQAEAQRLSASAPGRQFIVYEARQTRGGES